MKTHHHPTTFVHLINIIGLLGICVILVIAFYYQVVRHELPCPLCLLQRVGFIIIGFGFLFNLYFGLRGLHYGMVIIGSILTGVMASRQMFLHIMPGDAGYGSTFLGLHFYTWSLIISVLIMAAVAVALAINSMNITFRSLNINPALFSIAGWVFLFLITSNLISTVLECGGGECAANPVLYNLLSK
ncbi:TPA: disulfide bond formation protein B [Salmonella enterica subsp. indica]|uniref:Disulfide bond formation protein B n=1 Tax=Salmonella enterica subsp. arizonae TaxID=59203 RepID=A0A5Y2QGR6_SALER|nr:disulfide bond formation protein B [Salmonella enterica]ECF4921689.1 disulfide bond formation protein B [Salmonella enterica subsp. arizonae]HAE8196862.1 disulfide bond formation protein B [Salmonella enterica subsp. indica serovar 41:b:1,7]HAU3217971.1 disulfide bond formation protein B [Salmonella enterica subsp. indica]ECI9860495.1 disulfide bond formation protein B [Salmonella enterica subsp. arizonae]HBC0155587.1 disulfide bond formation protein B [Salmonella enterica subsp. indica]